MGQRVWVACRQTLEWTLLASLELNILDTGNSLNSSIGPGASALLGTNCVNKRVSQV